MRIWKDTDGKWHIGGYQPNRGTLDESNPPRGGSGVVQYKGAVTAVEKPVTKLVQCPFADHLPGLAEEET